MAASYVESEFCYAGADDGLRFAVPNPPPDYYRRPRPIPLISKECVDGSTLNYEYDLFRRDGVNGNGIVRYVLHSKERNG